MNSQGTLLKFVGKEPKHVFSELNRIESGLRGIHCHTCTPNMQFSGLPTPIQLLKCGGAGTSDMESINSAIGEGLERYSALCYSLEAPAFRSSLSRLAEINKENYYILRPSLWIAYSDEQYDQPNFGLCPLTDQSTIKWYHAKSYLTSNTYLVPGPLSIFAYRRGEYEERHSPTTSTGLALGTSFEQAHLSGLLEVIERDSIVLAWTYRRPAKRVRQTDPHFIEILEELGITDEYDVSLYDITQEVGIPTYFATLEHVYQGQKLICTGSAARAENRSAARKALLEAVQGIPYTKWLSKKHDVQSEFPHSWVDSFEKSAIYYSINRNLLLEIRDRWGDVLKISQETDIPYIPNKNAVSDHTLLVSLLDKLSSAGHSSYFIDCTKDNLRKEGMSVIKSLIPSLYSLEGNYNHRILNPCRARDLSLNEFWDVELCHYPHPLP